MRKVKRRFTTLAVHDHIGCRDHQSAQVIERVALPKDNESLHILGTLNNREVVADHIEDSLAPRLKVFR